MRKNLADLRGQLVAWKGWETNSRFNNTWACISKATVTPWRFNIPIQKSFTKNLTKVDHFWLTSDQKNNIQQESMQYEKLGGIGVVKSYMRNDGSIDFTIKRPPKIYCIERIIEKLNVTFEHLADKERIKGLKDIKELIDAHTPENPTLYSMITDFNGFKKEVYDELEFLESSYALTSKALKTVKMNGKCKKLDLLRLKKQTKSKSKGFL
tara:strand:+ start:466 stop:1095 length:630 start_codon:yes stop_codon:yes gene_type:complete